MKTRSTPIRGRAAPLSLYTESVFLDSGAYGLYNVHVRKMHQTRIGLHGRELDVPKVMRGRGDFSYYTLEKGSKFRAYCDGYARWLRHVQGMGLNDLLYVNIDVITNPEMTWTVQQYLEQEHGLTPIPVIHAGTSLHYIHKYLETGRYKLIGLGGLGQNIGLEVYRRWADEVFTMLCPESNKSQPLVRVHGFAMTSWEFICRWPWWSVDSATWVKLAAYGWLYIPYWSESDGWDYGCPPIQINVSSRSPFLHKKDRHAMSERTSRQLGDIVDRWLDRCGLKYGEVEQVKTEKKGPSLVFKNTVVTEEQVEEWGVQSHFAARAAANLHYLKDLEESRPVWPSPLDAETVWQGRVKITKGLGLGYGFAAPDNLGMTPVTAPSRMRIYFSGGRGLCNTPEALIPKRKPHVMLTFLDMENNGTLKRFNVYLGRKTNKQLSRRKHKKKNNHED